MEQRQILVVDDQRGVRYLLDDFLSEEGYTTYLVNNGLEAVKFVENNYPELILMDIQMPVMDGLKALSIIKDIKGDIPVFMMTAAQDKKLEAAAYNLGAICCFNKPFDFQELLAEVKKVL